MKKVQFEFSFLSPKKDIAVLKIKGEVDMGNIQEFKDFLAKVLESSYEKLIMDLHELRYMNSTGFGVLASTMQQTETKQILVCHLHPNILKTYRSFGIEQMWPPYPTLQDALTALQKGKPSTEAMPETIHFPLIRTCTNCRKASNFSKPGRYKCPFCATIHQIDEQGNLSPIVKKVEVPSQTTSALANASVAKTVMLPVAPIPTLQTPTMALPPSLVSSLSNIESPPEQIPAPPTPSESDEIDITIPSNGNHLRRIRDFIFSFADEIFDDQERYNMASAVDEAIANAIEHAHNNDRSKKIFIHLEVTPQKFSITVKDSGENTFSRIVQREQLTQDQLKKLGRGMGLMVIKQTMDEVNFKPTETFGTAITMVKYVKPKSE